MLPAEVGVPLPLAPSRSFAYCPRMVPPVGWPSFPCPVLCLSLTLGQALWKLSRWPWIHGVSLPHPFSPSLHYRKPQKAAVDRKPSSCPSAGNCTRFPLLSPAAVITLFAAPVPPPPSKLCSTTIFSCSHLLDNPPYCWTLRYFQTYTQ